MKLNLDHTTDLEVGCPVCAAAVGAECVGTKPGTVHFNRRIANLARDPEALARMEAALGHGGAPEERN
jgi:hypothetical protein